MPEMPGLDDIVEWDVPNWSVALRYWIAETRQDLSSADALEIGSRGGGLSLWAAWKGMRVLCTDVAGPAAAAVEKHARYGVADRIEYGTLDALNIPFVDRFDVVLFKSVLGGIGSFGKRDDQAKAIAEMHKSLRPGGELWFAENLVASPLHGALRRRHVQWGQRWRYVTIDEMKSFMAVFSEVRYTTVGLLGLLGRTPLQRRVLGRLDRLFADRLVPETWRYVMIGMARK